jgi:hypothetical protein
VRIEFINIAHRLNAQCILISAAAIAQARGAIVTSTCSYFGKSVSHVSKFDNSIAGAYVKSRINAE